jgi:hypothetical protein
MKRSFILVATFALAATLLAIEPAAAYRYHRGWHGGHWRYGWHHSHWRYGWRGAHWRYAWRGGWGWNRWGWNNPYYNPYYGYAYNYPYGSGLAATATAPFALAAAATTAPLMTGRSVAIGNGQMGNYCTTPVKTCLLRNESWVGNGCSCRIPPERARGTVTQ